MPHISMHRVSFAVLTTIVTATLPLRAHAAPAQDASVFGEHTDVMVGAGLGLAPRYPGADRWQAVPTPALDIERGILFVDSLRGLGLQYQSSSKFYVSQSFYYDLGRLERDNPWRPGSKRLMGMGDVPGSATARTLVGQELAPWLTLSVETEMALRQAARRNRYRTGAEFMPLKNATETVTVDLDLWWGDARYNLAWFGVTPQQSARTGLRAFSPGAGLMSQSPSVSWEHRFDQHWAGTLQVAGVHYGGRTGASPIVSQRNALSPTAVLAYRY